jgi:PhnB protein
MLSIYLTFNGNCREAFDYYKAVFGGEFAEFQTFGDGPPEMAVADENKDRVMHVSLPVGSSTLMGADTQNADAPFETGTNFSITVAPESRKLCDEYFSKLAAGGVVTMTLQDTFWGAYFGMCRDRFNINWIFNFDAKGD